MNGMICFKKAAILLVARKEFHRLNCVIRYIDMDQT